MIKFNVQVKRAFLDKSFYFVFVIVSTLFYSPSPPKKSCVHLFLLFNFFSEMSLESLSSVYISVILINFPLPFPFLS